jgi:ribosomal protein L37AE/L43A
MDEAELAKAKILTNVEMLKEKLPEYISRPSVCPLCKGEMQGFQLRTNIRYYTCSKCGYKQPGIDLQASSTDISSLAAALGIGVLAGLGIAALLYLLFGSEGS